MINNKLIVGKRIDINDLFVAEDDYGILEEESNVHQIGNVYMGIVIIHKKRALSLLILRK